MDYHVQVDQFGKYMPPPEGGPPVNYYEKALGLDCGKQGAKSGDQDGSEILCTQVTDCGFVPQNIKEKILSNKKTAWVSFAIN